MNSYREALKVAWEKNDELRAGHRDLLLRHMELIDECGEMFDALQLALEENAMLKGEGDI